MNRRRVRVETTGFGVLVDLTVNYHAEVDLAEMERAATAAVQRAVKRAAEARAGEVSR